MTDETNVSQQRAKLITTILEVAFFAGMLLIVGSVSNNNGKINMCEDLGGKMVHHTQKGEYCELNFNEEMMENKNAYVLQPFNISG